MSESLPNTIDGVRGISNPQWWRASGLPGGVAIGGSQLRLAGGVDPQNIEVVSLDVGNDELGLDRTLPGHYPSGTHRIGAGAAAVDMVDDHDSDGLGQGACEAIYVDQLIIDAGATLNTNGCKVYYVTLINDGAVDDPANLVMIGCVDAAQCDDGVFCTSDACDGGTCVNDAIVYGDVNDSGVVDLDDILCVIAGFGAADACPTADIAGCEANGLIDLDDILAIIGAFGGTDPCCGG